MTAPSPRSPGAPAFAVVDLIRTKRDGGELAPEAVDWLVSAYTDGVVAEEQMAAMAMAVLFRGLSRSELSRWTAAMIASGERLDFSGLSRPTVDKHSTGGVGDKITLPLAPLVAACGVAVPQLSGRGLGHTGGTLDKLESIPGWRASLSNAEVTAQSRTRLRGAVTDFLGAGGTRAQGGETVTGAARTDQSLGAVSERSAGAREELRRTADLGQQHTGRVRLQP